MKLPSDKCHCTLLSILVQVMAWCRQATSHYLSKCWPWSLSQYGVIRPQWLKKNKYYFHDRMYISNPFWGIACTDDILIVCTVTYHERTHILKWHYFVISMGWCHINSYPLELRLSCTNPLISTRKNRVGNKVFGALTRKQISLICSIQNSTRPSQFSTPPAQNALALASGQALVSLTVKMYAFSLYLHIIYIYPSSSETH